MTETIADRADRLVRNLQFAIIPLHTVDEDTGACTCGSGSCSSPAKHPIASLVPNGVENATTDPSLVREWWALWPDANIGIATGDISGVIVLDIDAQHGGALSLTNLEAKNGKLPETWTVHTGGGGLHLYFEYVEGIRNRVGVVPGIDIRSDKGYVVAPPSLHISGNRYVWDDYNKPCTSFQRPAHAPDWLIRLAGGHGTERTRASAVVGTISEGGRNTTLASLAGTMRRRGMEEDEIFAALRLVNQNRCNPPLTEKEVGTIAWSIARLPPSTAEVQSLTYGGKRG